MACTHHWAQQTQIFSPISFRHLKLNIMNRDGGSLPLFPSLQVSTVLNPILIIPSCFHTTSIYADTHRVFIEFLYFKFYQNSIMQCVYFYTFLNPIFCFWVALLRNNWWKWLCSFHFSCLILSCMGGEQFLYPFSCWWLLVYNCYRQYCFEYRVLEYDFREAHSFGGIAGSHAHTHRFHQLVCAPTSRAHSPGCSAHSLTIRFHF